METEKESLPLNYDTNTFFFKNVQSLTWTKYSLKKELLKKKKNWESLKYLDKTKANIDVPINSLPFLISRILTLEYGLLCTSCFDNERTNSYASLWVFSTDPLIIRESKDPKKVEEILNKYFQKSKPVTEGIKELDVGKRSQILFTFSDALFTYIDLTQEKQFVRMGKWHLYTHITDLQTDFLISDKQTELPAFAIDLFIEDNTLKFLLLHKKMKMRNVRETDLPGTKVIIAPNMLNGKISLKTGKFNFNTNNSNFNNNNNNQNKQNCFVSLTLRNDDNLKDKENILQMSHHFWIWLSFVKNKTIESIQFIPIILEGANTPILFPSNLVFVPFNKNIKPLSSGQLFKHEMSFNVQSSGELTFNNIFFPFLSVNNNENKNNLKQKQLMNKNTNKDYQNNNNHNNNNNNNSINSNNNNRDNLQSRQNQFNSNLNNNLNSNKYSLFGDISNNNNKNISGEGEFNEQLEREKVRLKQAHKKRLQKELVQLKLKILKSTSRLRSTRIVNNENKNENPNNSNSQNNNTNNHNHNNSNNNNNNGIDERKRQLIHQNNQTYNGNKNGPENGNFLLKKQRLNELATTRVNNGKGYFKNQAIESKQRRRIKKSSFFYQPSNENNLTKGFKQVYKPYTSTNYLKNSLFDNNRKNNSTQIVQSPELSFGLGFKKILIPKRKNEKTISNNFCDTLGILKVLFSEKDVKIKIKNNSAINVGSGSDSGSVSNQDCNSTNNNKEKIGMISSILVLLTAKKNFFREDLKNFKIEETGFNKVGIEKNTFIKAKPVLQLLSIESQIVYNTYTIVNTRKLKRRKRKKIRFDSHLRTNKTFIPKLLFDKNTEMFRKAFLTITKENMIESCIKLKIPQTLCGFDHEWTEIPPYNAMQFWESLLLEPYLNKRNIQYFKISPNNEEFELFLESFFEDLSSVYNMCNFGSHTPSSLAHYVSSTEGEENSNDNRNINASSPTNNDPNNINHRKNYSNSLRSNAQRANINQKQQNYNQTNNIRKKQQQQQQQQQKGLNRIPIKIDKITNNNKNKNQFINNNISPQPMDPNHNNNFLDVNDRVSPINNKQKLDSNMVMNMNQIDQRDLLNEYTQKAEKLTRIIQEHGRFSNKDNSKFVVYVIDPFDNTIKNNNKFNSFQISKALTPLTDSHEIPIFIQIISLFELVNKYRKIQSELKNLCFSVYSRVDTVEQFSPPCILSRNELDSGRETNNNKDPNSNVTTNSNTNTNTNTKPSFIFKNVQRIHCSYCLTEHFAIYVLTDQLGEILTTSFDRVNRRDLFARIWNLINDFIQKANEKLNYDESNEFKIFDWNIVIVKDGLIEQNEYSDWMELINEKNANNIPWVLLSIQEQLDQIQLLNLGENQNYQSLLINSSRPLHFLSESNFVKNKFTSWIVEIEKRKVTSYSVNLIDFNLQNNKNSREIQNILKSLTVSISKDFYNLSWLTATPSHPLRASILPLHIFVGRKIAQIFENKFLLK
ncbi:mediator of RNA polymerase ii transcription subunit [Anaeramoeba flamelloides]|uniref:Mediator of RNA polymerase II transcription subunit 13 n=1 Tax=Anaeramoeba flamelloides TaxID=1746091 RepID=A0AAV8AH20_9EUKA|nr:mediator of RNA polymerase ii transcription subunit [Anaeramoeba flamelloides]